MKNNARPGTLEFSFIFIKVLISHSELKIDHFKNVANELLEKLLQVYIQSIQKVGILRSTST